MISSLRCPGETSQCQTLTIGSRSALVIAISRNYLLVYLCQAYGARRYGLDMPCDELSQAMRILSNSVYNVNTTARNFHGHVLILRHPSLGLKVLIIIHASPNVTQNTQDLAWYKVSEVVTAWGLFVSAASHLNHSPTFLYDLVDLTRQALANIAPIFYLKVKEAYR